MKSNITLSIAAAILGTINLKASDRMDLDQQDAQVQNKRNFNPAEYAGSDEYVDIVSFVNNNFQDNPENVVIVDNPAKRLQLSEGQDEQVDIDVSLQLIDGNLSTFLNKFVNARYQADYNLQQYAFYDSSIFEPGFAQYYLTYLKEPAIEFSQRVGCRAFTIMPSVFKKYGQENDFFDCVLGACSKDEVFLLRELDAIEFMAETYRYPQVFTFLGNVYANGSHGVESNPELAFIYYNKAMEQDYAPAKLGLLMMDAKAAFAAGSEDAVGLFSKAKEMLERKPLFRDGLLACDEKANFITYAEIPDDPKDPKSAIFDRKYLEAEVNMHLAKISMAKGEIEDAYYLICTPQFGFFKPEGFDEFRTEVRTIATQFFERMIN